MKCFARKEKFYNLKKPIVSESQNQDKMNRIQEIHRKWDHASYNELINLYKYTPSEFKELSKEDIKNWKEEFGDFCTGCIEGAMKEMLNSNRANLWYQKYQVM